MLKNKKLTLLSLIIGLFIGLQVFAINHNIEHSFESKHASDFECEILATSNNISDDVKLEIALNLEDSYVVSSYKENQIFSSIFNKSNSSRSPPYFVA